MNKKTIQKHVNPFFTIEYIDSIDSTNDELKRNFKTLQEGYTLIANHQTHGRGRNDHSFYSKENNGIYLSFLLKPKISLSDSLKIMAISAIAIVETIQKNYDIESGIKWVNDIFIQDKKVAGILCESKISSASNHLEYMIVGIGINLHSYTMPDSLSEIAGCVEDYSSKIIPREQFISDLLNTFYIHYQNIKDPYIIEFYKKYSCILNKTIKVIEPKKSYIAKAIDIDKHGYLIIEKNNKKFPLVSGEIHVRNLNI